MPSCSPPSRLKLSLWIFAGNSSLLGKAGSGEGKERPGRKHRNVVNVLPRVEAGIMGLLKVPRQAQCLYRYREDSVLATPEELRLGAGL